MNNMTSEKEFNDLISQFPEYQGQIRDYLNSGMPAQELRERVANSKLVDLEENGELAKPGLESIRYQFAQAVNSDAPAWPIIEQFYAKDKPTSLLEQEKKRLFVKPFDLYLNESRKSGETQKALLQQPREEKSFFGDLGTSLTDVGPLVVKDLAKKAAFSAAALFGENKLSDFIAKSIEEGAIEQAKYPMKYQSMKESWESPEAGSFLHWGLTVGLGQNAPQLAANASLYLINPAVGLAATVAQASGDIAYAQKEETGKVDIIGAAPLTFAYAWLDKMLPADLAKTIQGPAKEILAKGMVKDLMKNAAFKGLQVAESAGKEVATEGLQVIIAKSAAKVIDENYQVFSDTNIKQAIEEGVAGGFGGAGAKATAIGVSDLIGKSKSPKKGEETPTPYKVGQDTPLGKITAIDGTTHTILSPEGEQLKIDGHENLSSLITGTDRKADVLTSAVGSDAARPLTPAQTTAPQVVAPTEAKPQEDQSLEELVANLEANNFGQGAKEETKGIPYLEGMAAEQKDGGIGFLQGMSKEQPSGPKSEIAPQEEPAKGIPYLEGISAVKLTEADLATKSQLEALKKKKAQIEASPKLKESELGKRTLGIIQLKIEDLAGKLIDTTKPEYEETAIDAQQAEEQAKELANLEKQKKKIEDRLQVKDTEVGQNLLANIQVKIDSLANNQTAVKPLVLTESDLAPVKQPAQEAPATTKAETTKQLSPETKIEPTSDVEKSLGKVDPMNYDGVSIEGMFMDKEVKPNTAPEFDKTLSQPKEKGSMDLGKILDEDGTRKTEPVKQEKKQAPKAKEAKPPVKKTMSLIDGAKNDYLDTQGQTDLNDEIKRLGGTTKFKLKSEAAQWIRNKWTTLGHTVIKLPQFKDLKSIRAFAKKEGVRIPETKDLVENKTVQGKEKAKRAMMDYVLEARKELARQFPESEHEAVLLGNKTYTDLPEGHAMKATRSEIANPKKRAKGVPRFYVYKNKTTGKEKTMAEPATEAQLKYLEVDNYTAWMAHGLRISDENNAMAEKILDKEFDKLMAAKGGNKVDSYSAKAQVDEMRQNMKAGKKADFLDSGETQGESEEDVDPDMWAKDINEESQSQEIEVNISTTAKIQALADAMKLLNKKRMRFDFYRGGKNGDRGSVNQSTGIIRINLDPADSSDMLELLVHEDFTHMALEGILGKEEFNKILDRVSALSMEGKDLAYYGKQVKEKYSKPDGTISDNVYKNEVLANWYQYNAGLNEPNGIFRDLIIKVTRFFRKEFKTERTELEDVKYVLNKAFQKYIESDKSGFELRVKSQESIVKNSANGIEDDVFFSLSSSYQQKAASIIKKQRPDLDANIIMGELEDYPNDETAKAALHWRLKDRVILIEDKEKIVYAVKLAKSAKVNPLDYESPVEIIDAFSDENQKVKQKIDPNKESRLYKLDVNIVDDENVVEEYQITDDNAKGQRLARDIMDGEWGVDANPWCLTYQEDGKLTESAKERWEQYSETDKRLVYLNGKLNSFYANGEYWDRNDVNNDGVMIKKPVKDFPDEPKAYRFVNHNTGASTDSLLYVGNKSDGEYKEYSSSKNLLISQNYKNGKLHGEQNRLYKGRISMKSIYNNGLLKSEKRYFDGKLFKAFLRDDNENIIATYEFNKNGLLESRETYGNEIDPKEEDQLFSEDPVLLEMDSEVMFSKDIKPEPKSPNTKPVDNGDYSSENNLIFYSKKIDSDTKLYAAHNTSARGIIHAHGISGIPAPSFAISKEGIPFTNFGDITLVGSKDIIDPKTGYVSVYSADAYSPRQPDPDYDVSKKGLQALELEMNDSLKKFGQRDVYSIIFNTSMSSSAGSSKDSFLKDTGTKLFYLASIGKKPVIKYIPKRLRDNGIRSDKSLVEFAKSLTDAYPEWNSNKDFYSDLAVRYNKFKLNSIMESLKSDNYEPSQEEIDYFIKESLEDPKDPNFGTMDRFLRDLYDVKMGKTELDTEAIQSFIDKNKKIIESEDYSNWVESKMDSVFVNPTVRISGKKEQYNAENVSKAMLASGIKGKEDARGLGSIRAMTTKMFSTIEEMKKDEKSLVSSEVQKAYKDDMGERFLNLMGSLREFYAYDKNSFGSIDDANDAIKAMAGGMLIGNAYKKFAFKNVPDSLSKEILKLVKELGNSPTHYFEAKVKRAVKLSEFRAAIVPSTQTTGKHIDILKDNGVEIYKYTKGNEESWLKAMRKASKDQGDIMFSKKIDRDYLELAKDPEVNKDKLQDMVDKAAKLAGYAVKAYHVTQSKFNKFNIKKSTQGVFWFTESKDKIDKGETGAAINGGKKSVTMNVFLKTNKTAGWKEYNKLGLFEIKRDGFDSIKLDDDYVIFDPSRIKSADPIIRIKGEIVPLSERFKDDSEDIRYSKSIDKDPTFKPVDTNSKAFKAWFGDSKVVDKNGEPLVVYHGTPYDGIIEFKKDRLGTGPITANPIAKHGFFFGPNPDWLDSYHNGSGSLTPVYLSMRKPFRSDMFAMYQKHGLENIQRMPDPDKIKLFIKALKSKGHDGIILEQNGKPVEFMVFSPTQIKSAISNTGDFDPNNPDIRYSKAIAVDPSKMEKLGDALNEISTLDLEDDQVSIPKFNGEKDTLIEQIGDDEYLYVRNRDEIKEAGPHEFFILDYGDEVKAFIRTTKNKTSISPNLVFVNPENRQEGVATSFYEYFLNSGMSINSDKEITEGTAALYQKLVKKGYQFSVNDNGTVRLEPKENRLYSKYLSPDLSTKIGSRNTLDQQLRDRGMSLTDRIITQAKIIISKFTQGALDKGAPLKGLDSSGTLYELNRSALGIATAVNSFLKHGEISWKGNSPTVKTRLNGITELFREMGADSAEKYLLYRMGERAEAMAKAGRNPSFNAAERKELLALGNGIKNLDSVNKRFNALNESVLNFAVESGLLHPDLKAKFKEEFYIPFYRVMDDQADQGFYNIASKYGGKNIDNYIEKYVGGDQKIGDPMENMIKNWTTLINQSIQNKMRDPAVRRMHEMGLAVKMIQRPVKAKPDLSIGDTDLTTHYDEKIKYKEEPILDDVTLQKEGLEYFNFTTPYDKKKERILSHMENGERVHYRILSDEMLVALTVAKPELLDNWVMKSLMLPKRMLTYTATFGWAFKVANGIRDTTVIALTHKNFNPFIDTFNGMYKSFMQDEDYVRQMSAMGGFESGYTGSDSSETAKNIRKSIKPFTILSTPARALKFWEDIGSAMENGARLGLFLKREKEFGTTKAAFDARDTLDFHLTGAADSVRVLTALTPFLNARLQGMYKLGRSAKQNPKHMAVGLSIMAVATMVLWAARDEEKWKELQDYDKYVYWHFWIGGAHFKIPKPFEASVVSNAIELMMEIMNGDEDMKKIMPFMISTLRDNLNLLDMPAAMKPVVEQWANKEFFTGRDIVPSYLQRLAPEAQAEPYTGTTVKLLANGIPDMAALVKGEGLEFGVSPLRVQHLAKAFGSTVAETILSTTDWVINGVDQAIGNPLGTKPRPSMSSQDVPLFGRFIRTDVPRNTKYGTEYYKMRDEISNAYLTLQHYKKLGDLDAARDLMESNKWQLRMKTFADVTDKRLGLLRKKANSIWGSENMAPDEKKRQLDDISKRQTEIQKIFYDKYRELRKQNE